MKFVVANVKTLKIYELDFRLTFISNHIYATARYIYTEAD